MQEQNVKYIHSVGEKMKIQYKLGFFKDIVYIKIKALSISRGKDFQLTYP